ncbi:MAG TPA: hypothetical protein DGR79_03570 [Clostridiales bacterium]|nr:hypothetical protein [Clostridiales bacterium]
MSRRILVVSSCTAKKADEGCPSPLSIEDFRDAAQLRDGEARLSGWRLPAVDMYTGPQHLHVRDGVDALRRRLGPGAVSLKIISAGYGLLDEDTPVVPYEVTFNTMSRSEARAWARHLRIPHDVRRACGGYDLVIFLLGSRYLDALDPPIATAPGQRLIFLAKPSDAPRLVGPGVTVVPAGKAETRYGAGLVALKGWMFRLFASAVARTGEALLEDVMRDDTPGAFLRALELGLDRE